MRARIVTPSERTEQLALVKWLSLHAKLKDYFFKIDNEGKRTEKQGFMAKMLGLKPGVSDLFIFYPTKTYHGLFLEMKRNKVYSKSERATPSWIAQESFLDNVKMVGYQGHFCYGWVEGKRIVEEYLTT
jgi:hypothetical protein